jgi:Flp pilus assembly protein CpaB
LEDRAKRRARLFTIVGFILAIAAAGGTYLYGGGQVEQVAPPEEAKVDVVVATRDLSARQQIEAADVTVAKYPATVAPPGAARDPREVIGRVLTGPVARNEPITQVRFATKQGEAAFTVFPPGETLTPNSPHYRAMSISVPDQNAVGGNLVPGDIVDVIVTINIDPHKYFEPTPPAPPNQRNVVDFQSKMALATVSILAKAATIYTIRVGDLDTAQRITYLQASGAQLSLVLRAPKDERVAQTQGASFPTIYLTHGFRVVQRLPSP